MNRAESLLALDRSPAPWDVCVIGGGATGLGTALDAAARGYRTVLVERDDFAKSTSSRSTKLIHGGVRYLRQGRIALVMESLRERGRLFRNAPHLVRALEFVIPARAGWEVAFYGAGLKLYDGLAGSAGLACCERLRRSRILSRAETLARLPGLNAAGVRGGVSYWDGQFDDARLAIALARTIEDQGGTVLNYAPVTGLLKRAGKVAGVRIRDAETGVEREIPARVTINATGVFTDAIRGLDEPGAAPVIAASQGAHIVLPLELLGGPGGERNSAMMIPRTADGRVLFAIPWNGRLVIGTTDNAVREITAEPRPMGSEIDFILDAAGRYLAAAPRREEILSAFAGLRPLVCMRRAGRARGVRRTAAISREHVVFTSASGLISIAGGKWTTYRKMGEDAVDCAAKAAGLPVRACGTEALTLHGGTDAAEMAALGADAPLHPRLPYTAAHVIWGARREMARTVEDILARRTRALLLDAAASIECAPAVTRLLAGEMGRGEAWAVEQAAAYAELARGYLAAGG